MLIWNDSKDRSYMRTVVAENSIWAVPRKESRKVRAALLSLLSFTLFAARRPVEVSVDTPIQQTLSCLRA